MEMFVPSFVSVTVAPSMTAPLASCTTPVMRDALPCARAAGAKVRSNEAIRANADRLRLFISFSVVRLWKVRQSVRASGGRQRPLYELDAYSNEGTVDKES